MSEPQTLSQEARTALQSVSIVGSLVYPPTQLETQVADELSRVFVGLRGVHHRTERAYAFPGDPREGIESVLATNAIPVSNPLSFYPTPPSVIDLLLDGLPEEGRFYEPSAGDGGILDAIRRRYPQVGLECAELDPYRRNVLRQKGYEVVAEDCLHYRPDEEHLYDAAVGNVPFTDAMNRTLYMDHYAFIWNYCVKPGGWMKGVAPSGYTTRKDARSKAFRAFIEAYGSWEIMGKEAFRVIGVSVATTIFSVRKPLDYTGELLLPSPGEQEPRPARAKTERTSTGPAKGRRRRVIPESALIAAEEKRESVRGWLSGGAKALFDEMQNGSSDNLKAWIAVASRFFWKYSAHNILLIRYQNPQAMHLEGFSSWQTRYSHIPQKDERGISIQTPLPWKKEKETNNGQVEVEEGLGFRVKAVFDVSQVHPLTDEQRERAEQREPREDDDEESQVVKLPGLPYIPEEEYPRYQLHIEREAQRSIPLGEGGLAEQRFACRRAFVRMLVMQYYGLSAPLPQEYHAVWQRGLTDQKELMQELEAIRQSAKEVLANVSAVPRHDTEDRLSVG